MNMNKQGAYNQLVPMMISFFVMGFVDLTGIATNYVKADLGLSDTIANLLPSMVFFWFLILSIPIGIWMNRIGCKKMVLISLVVTASALLVPLFGYNFALMLLSFSLLGIGNTLMQVSLNPLLSAIVRGEKLASSLTFGQFIKAIASFSAPIIAAWGASLFMDWKILFPIFLGIAAIALVGLSLSKIQEEQKKPDGKSSSFRDCFSLLEDKVVLLSFIGIICHVGIDVGINLTAPKILIERLGLEVEKAGYITSIYFLFRTLGCLSGSFILARWSDRKFFLFSSVIMFCALIGLFLFKGQTPVYICIAMIGFGNSNIFPILFSRALLHKPQQKNEVSGLMITGLFGGTLFPFFMGIASDALASQTGALLVVSLGMLYLLFLSFRNKQNA